MAQTSISIRIKETLIANGADVQAQEEEDYYDSNKVGMTPALRKPCQNDHPAARGKLCRPLLCQRQYYGKDTITLGIGSLSSSAGFAPITMPKTTKTLLQSNSHARKVAWRLSSG